MGIKWRGKTTTKLYNFTTNFLLHLMLPALIWFFTLRRICFWWQWLLECLIVKILISNIVKQSSVPPKQQEQQQRTKQQLKAEEKRKKKNKAAKTTITNSNNKRQKNACVFFLYFSFIICLFVCCCCFDFEVASADKVISGLSWRKAKCVERITVCAVP